MPIVEGKKKLCSCEKKYFKSIQGLGNHSLFARYNDIENVVNTVIDQRYRSFLAQPIEDDDKFIWFSKPYNETPVRLSELQGEDLAKYIQIKNDTIQHYQNVIGSLKDEGKNNVSETLEKALKFINDDFLYCYDDKIVLGIWGMQLKENVREPMGTVCKTLINPKVNSPVIDEAPKPDPTEPVTLFKVSFNAGESGNLTGNSELIKHAGEIISEKDVPGVEPKSGWDFTGWNINPNNYNVNGDTEFTAQYKPIVPPPIPLPWYRRFWNGLRSLFIGKGCLNWLLWLLLLLLLLLLLGWLLRSCSDEEAKPIPDPIHDKPWVHSDPNVRDGGGIYDPGNPYETVPTAPEYRDILPPSQGVLPPIDTTKIIRQPGNPVILSNRLNILMANENKSILDLAKEFKAKYPDDIYKVVYYDDVVKRMQIEVPPEERLNLKSEIPEKFAPEYELFVFDEALFEEYSTPNDPELADPDKSWYLNAINALQAWNITKGSPKLTIAIIDNGFSLDHPELQNKVVMPYNVWLHSKEIYPQRVDHGTHVAGTALAIADNGIGLCGIAPECAFMPVQVADEQEIMTTTSILDGILYALYQGADVINVSLSMQFTSPLSEDLQKEIQNNRNKEEERLWNKVMEISDKHKAIIVIAAGNENMLAGVNPMNRPKNFIIVSALDKSNRELQKAGFSNYGDYSTISAPGVDIYSTVGNNNYQVMNGTSMASPIVTGAIALMKSINQDLTAQQIICILQETGKPTEGNIGNLIQIDKALQKVMSGEFTNCDSRPETPTNDIIPSPKSFSKTEGDLIREREQLLRQIDRIDRELQNIRNNKNFKK